MHEDTFAVEHVDHVEVFVRDQYEAAAWYGQILGLQILPQYEVWAPNGGPLMISSDDGNTMLALFVGEPQGRHRVVGLRRVAFRVTADGFMRFLDRLERMPVYDKAGARVTAAVVADHTKAFSVYFCDPDGNPDEVTTYDHAEVAARLGR